MPMAARDHPRYPRPLTQGREPMRRAAARNADKPRQAPVNGLRSATLAMALGVLIHSAQVAVAQDCPTAKSVAEGFVVERGESSKTEVFHVGDTTVRTVFRYGGSALLETTQFQGLFELERIDRGRRTVFKPTSDLSKVYPPNVGQKFSAKFEMTTGERRSTQTVILAVKKPDTLHIGPCQYQILLIDRNVGYD